MADQGKDNQTKEEWTSKKEGQVGDEMTSNNKCQTKDDDHLEKDEQVEAEDEAMKERTFHQFLSLPAELRLIIWEYALPKGRVLRICPNEDTDDEYEDEDDDEEQYDNYYYGECSKYKKKGIDQWGFPTSCYAPEILNPKKFLTFPLAAVCQESREFIIDFGYETLYGNLMTINGDRFQGPWFCHDRDTIEEFTDDMIVKLSSGGLRGDWIYE
ncbi:hypothetical protein F4859DRAFT_509988 [Xylaria cf. heliscus]|nr:hypothetical protein F4859DRAFT_509988 [Xylaria cf. heliscus]